MTKSDSIAALAAALAKAQGAMQNAQKDQANPHFRSKYADLSSIWEACRAPLFTNGLAVSQIVGATEDHRVTVDTILMHSSGEWISGSITLAPVREKKDQGFVSATDPQAMGSAITYGRRYALAAIVGVAPEDDDGNAASGRNQSPAMDADRLADEFAEMQRKKQRVDTSTGEIMPTAQNGKSSRQEAQSAPPSAKPVSQATKGKCPLHPTLSMGKMPNGQAGHFTKDRTECYGQPQQSDADKLETLQAFVGDAGWEWVDFEVQILGQSWDTWVKANDYGNFDVAATAAMALFNEANPKAE